MARQRPAAVTTMGVLNIIVGSLGLLFSCCGGAGMYFLFSIPGRYDNFNRRPINEYRDMWDYMQTNLPLYAPVTIVSLVMGMLLAAVLLTAGIGLLNRQGWARITCIVYSVLSMVLLLAEVIFRLVFVLPALERWQTDFLRRYPTIYFGSTPASNFANGQIITSIIALLSLAYAFVLLVMMVLPHVSYYFATGPEPERDDEDDDDRRARRDWDD